MKGMKPGACKSAKNHKTMFRSVEEALRWMNKGHGKGKPGGK